MKLTPRSRASLSAAIDSDSLTGPHAEPIGQVPNPISETDHSVRPKRRVCIELSFRTACAQGVSPAARGQTASPPERKLSYHRVTGQIGNTLSQSSVCSL